MADTPVLVIPELADQQDGAETTHNRALRRLESILARRILDRDLATPPGSPTDGDAYIVATGGTGAWLGWDNRVVFSDAGTWRAIVPVEGLTLAVVDEDVEVRWSGSAWVARHRGWGLIYAAKNATNQTLTTTGFEQVLNFDTASANPVNVTEDLANDELILGKTGLWECTVAGAMSVPAGVILELQLFHNGAAVGPIVEMNGGGSTDYNALSIHWLLNVTTAGQILDLRAKDGLGTTTFRNRDLILAARLLPPW